MIDQRIYDMLEQATIDELNALKLAIEQARSERWDALYSEFQDSNKARLASHGKNAGWFREHVEHTQRVWSQS